MKNGLKIFLTVATAIVVGTSFSTSALAEVAPTKIAVVNIQAVVNSSAKVQALKKEQEAKAKDFVTFIEKARKDVAATTDVNKKKTLEEKYTKELNAKKEANDKAYAQKLAEIESAISNQIANVARANGYDMVVSNAIVLYGGNDITELVKASVAASEKAPAKSSKKR